MTTEYTDKHGNVVKTGKKLNGTEYFDTYTYDYVGNILTQLTAGDAQKSLAFTAKYEYNENGQVVKTYNVENLFTTNTYNSRGQLTAATDYAGTPTTYSYDALGRLLSETITIESGVTATNRYEYDAGGNIIREWKPINAVGSASAWEKTEYSYDSSGRLTTVAQYNSGSVASVTRYSYDGVGNTLSMTTGLSSLTAANGSTTTYTYDRYGNVLTMTDALGRTESYSYSDLGRLDSKTDRNGIVSSYSYDAMGRVLSERAGEDAVAYTYTLTGQIRSETSGWQLTEYTYDEFGRAVTVQETELEGYYQIPIILDANGGEVGVSILDAADYDTYALPTPTRTGYTFEGWYNGDTLVSNGDPVNITNGVTLVAHWTANTYTIVYHQNYSLVLTPLPLVAAIDNVQECTYDQDVSLYGDIFIRTGYGLAGWSTSSDGARVYHTGQTVKNLTAEPNGVVNLYAVWETAYAVPIVPPIEEEIMSLALPQTVEEESSSTETARLLTYTKTYSYDLSGNRTSFTITSGGEAVQTTTYTYDTLNRLQNVSEGGVLQAAYTYDANGNRASLTYANGVTTAYTYNLVNWVTSLSNQNATGVISSYAYSYYASGNQMTKTDNTGRVTTYTYDGLGRLTQESETNGITAAYTYDSHGNRTQLTVTGTESYTTSYSYDANNRLTQESKTEGEVVEITTYTYDANGNMLSRSTTSNASAEAATQHYLYDNFNRQVYVSVNGTLTAAYGYNARGIRTSKNAGSDVTTFLLDGGSVAGEVTDGGTTTYLWGVNLISRTADSTTRYYLYNAHGDVVNLTDSTGASTKTYDYDAFGVERDIDDTDANPFRYCGEYYDTETGTYYLRARYYNPLLGRFMQEDPIYSGLNWYTYCGNNPIVFVDPTGLEMVWIREIAEQYGGTVTWDEKNRTATVSFGSAGTYSSKSFSSAFRLICLTTSLPVVVIIRWLNWLRSMCL